MADIVSPEVRSRMMAGIRGKNTKPELLIRSGLHKRGFRFRLHDSRLPGKPDLVLTKWKTAIFIHGCFWHAHGCHLFKMPETRTEFWLKKLSKNAERDARVLESLFEREWRVLIVWECALKGPFRQDMDQLLKSMVSWIESGHKFLELKAKH